MKVEVFGTGCPGCRKLESMAQSAAAEIGVSCSIEHVQDIGRMVRRGVLAPPALAIDGEILVSGRLPSEQELLSWMRAAAR